jgi:hypothetical protein
VNSADRRHSEHTSPDDSAVGSGQVTDDTWTVARHLVGAAYEVGDGAHIRR